MKSHVYGNWGEATTNSKVSMLGKRQQKILLCVALVSLVLLLYTIQHKNLTKISLMKPNVNKPTKVVLVWNSVKEKTPLFFGRVGYDLFSECEIKDCYLTADREFMPIEDFAAVFFNVYTYPAKKERRELPAGRSPEQRYIFVNSEVPNRFYGKSLSQYVYNSFYNWTMSYRFDSDLVRRHGYVLDKPSATEIDKRILKTKTRSVAWIVSNCKWTMNDRNNIAKMLQKYIDVDIYGRCGNMTCKKNKDSQCRQMIADKYWFYLSFENSHCKDYSTEKLYTTLQYNIVPIVYGGADYNDIKIAPPHSVINVENFKKVKSLAKYLKYLMNNEELYLEFFRWKLKYSIYSSQNPVVCELCRRLHDPNEPPKVYKDIKYWWFNTKMSKCKSQKQVKKIQ